MVKNVLIIENRTDFFKISITTLRIKFFRCTSPLLFLFGRLSLFDYTIDPFAFESGTKTAIAGNAGRYISVFVQILLR